MIASFSIQENVPVDLTCPICLDLIRDACVGPCGHSFCQSCFFRLVRHSTEETRCPTCKHRVEASVSLIPNHSLDQLCRKERKRQAELANMMEGTPSLGKVQKVMADVGGSLSVHDINLLIDQLKAKRESSESKIVLTQQVLVKEFLERLQVKNEDQIERLQGENEALERDLQAVNANIAKVLKRNPDDIGEIPRYQLSDNYVEKKTKVMHHLNVSQARRVLNVSSV